MVAVNRSTDSNSVTHNYVTLGTDRITSIVKYKDSNDNLLNQTEQVASYNRNVISETDEYCAKKEYSYNNIMKLAKIDIFI